MLKVKSFPPTEKEIKEVIIPHMAEATDSLILVYQAVQVVTVPGLEGTALMLNGEGAIGLAQNFTNLWYCLLSATFFGMEME